MVTLLDRLPIEIRIQLLTFIPSDAVIQACESLGVDDDAFIEEFNREASMSPKSRPWELVMTRSQVHQEREERKSRSHGRKLFNILQEDRASRGRWEVRKEAREIEVKNIGDKEVLRLIGEIQKRDLYPFRVHRDIFDHLRFEVSDEPVPKEVDLVFLGYGTVSPPVVSSQVWKIYDKRSWKITRELLELQQDFVDEQAGDGYRSGFIRDFPSVEQAEIDRCLGISSWSIWDTVDWIPSRGLVERTNLSGQVSIAPTVSVHSGWLLARYRERRNLQKKYEQTSIFKLWQEFCRVSDGWEVDLEEESGKRLMFISLSNYLSETSEVVIGGSLDETRMNDLGYPIDPNLDSLFFDRREYRMLVEIDKFFCSNTLNLRDYRHWNGETPSHFW